MSLYVNTGYFLTPNSHFKATTYGIGLKYTSHQGGTLNTNNKTFKSAKFRGITFNVGQEVYFNAKRVFGFGLTSNPIFNKNMHLFVQLLAGGAGGGNVDTGQGLIVKPGAGLYYNISDKLAFRTAFGRVKATGSGLNSTYFNVGLSYRLAFLTGRN